MVNIRCKNVKFSNIKAIIFDKDGTLEDSQEFLRNLGQKRCRLIDAQIPGIGDPLLMSYGINGNYIDPTGLMAVGSRKENEIVAAGYIAETGRSWLESLTIARRAFEEADKMLQNAPPSPIYPGTLEVLEYLAKTDVKLGILSSARTISIEAFVKRYELDHYFQLKMGVDGSLMKPDPALFTSACQQLDVEPGVTLMVGDSPGDMEMGKNAGAAGCIGISWGKTNTPLGKADVTINHLKEIQIDS